MFWCDFMAGWAGGCLGLAVGHPFDTLKVRQQAFTNPSFMHAARMCIQHEGAAGLFKGMSYPLLSAGALNSLFFGVYGLTVRALEKAEGITEDAASAKDNEKKRLNYWNVFLGGCAGGAAQLVVACPVDLVKIKLQTQTKADGVFHGPFDVLKRVYKQQGVRGWYKGLVPMAWRDVPSFGQYIITYEWIVVRVCDRSKGEIPTPIQSIWMGGVAGVLSWLSVIYLDVVKSRIQADDPRNPRYHGMVDTFRKCYREGGMRMFTRGILAVSLRAFPLNGATFVGYEYCLNACRQFHAEEEDSL